MTDKHRLALRLTSLALVIALGAFFGFWAALLGLFAAATERVASSSEGAAAAARFKAMEREFNEKLDRATELQESLLARVEAAKRRDARRPN